MKTPKIFKQRINEGVVSQEILGACIYSLYKRAQNYSERYKVYYTYRCNYAEERSKYQCYMDIAKSMKGKYEKYYNALWPLFKPCEIHEYDTCNQYQEPIKQYFLYYNAAGHGLYKQIQGNLLSIYDDLKIVRNPSESTFKETPSEELISVQFVKKVLSGLSDGSLRLVA